MIEIDEAMFHPLSDWGTVLAADDNFAIVRADRDEDGDGLLFRLLVEDDGFWGLPCNGTIAAVDFLPSLERVVIAARAALVTEAA